MSDNELSDGMEELQDILRDYSSKDEQNSLASAINELTADVVPPTTLSGSIGKSSGLVKSEEQERIEKLVFGDKEGFLENLKRSSNPIKSADGEGSGAKKRKPAWQDEDDEELQVGEVKQETRYTGSLDHMKKEQPYKEFLQSRFKRIASTPKWAELDREVELDSDEEILRTVGFIDKKKSISLSPTNIAFKKLRDLNRTTYAEGSISSVEFHPTSTVAMVSGLTGVATLYAVDGRKNEKLHNMRFNEFPIKCAKILPGGMQALFASKYRHYYSYDFGQATEMRHRLPTHLHKISNFALSPNGNYFASNGRYGELHLFDLHSKEFIHTFKQEDPCRAILFSLDSTKIFTTSRSSSVNIFDIRSQRLMHSFIDDGCIKGKSIDISPDGKMLATGSSEGAVNIYDYEKVFQSSAPLPEKTILNLTTAITQIKFNHSSEMLAICSDQVPAAVKLVHFPTATVFANFPGFKNDLKSIRSMAFSPSSGFLALGSKEKETSLLRLKHFKNY